MAVIVFSLLSNLDTPVLFPPSTFDVVGPFSFSLTWAGVVDGLCVINEVMRGCRMSTSVRRFFSRFSFFRGVGSPTLMKLPLHVDWMKNIISTLEYYNSQKNNEINDNWKLFGMTDQIESISNFSPKNSDLLWKTRVLFWCFPLIKILELLIEQKIKLEVLGAKLYL